MATVKEYFELTKKYKMDYGDKTIVLYQVGSFFEVYAMVNADGTHSGSNIEEFSKINDMTIADKHTTYENKPVVMAGVGVAYIDKYLERLQEHGYTIVIYKQDINGKNTTRSLSEIISPGTFFPVESDNDVLSNNIMCIWIHKTNATKRNPQVQVILGIATIDIYTGKTSLFQFTADYIHSPTTYDELERYISAYTPSECLFVANMPESLIDDIIGFVGLEGKKIHKISTATQTGANISPINPTKNTANISPAKTGANISPAKTGANISPAKTGANIPPKGGLGGAAPQAEKQIYQQEVLKRFFPHMHISITDMFPTYYIATQSFVFLLDFVYQHNPNLVTRLTEPLFENYTNRLSLANHSLSQLNITDDSRHTGKMRSVGSFLNNCMTTMGKRNFLYQLHYPTTNESTLQAAYDITEHLLQNGTWQSVRTALSTITDLEKFVRKVVNRKSVPKDVSIVVEDLKVIEQLFLQSQQDVTLMDYLSKEEKEKEKEKSIAVVCCAIIEDIAATFNLEECRKTTDITDASSIINRGVSKTLDALTRDSLDGQDKLEAVCAFLSGLVKMEKEKEAKYVKIHETAKSAAVLLATSRRAVLLKDAVKKIGKSAAAVSYASRYSGFIETFDLDLSALEYTTGGSKNDVVITSPQIRAITSQNEESKEKRIREMQLIFQNYIAEFIKFQTDLQHCIKYATEMDLLQNKCYVAHKYNYCKPTLDGTKSKSFFSFTGIRHPLIEHIQTQELYVTNDLALGVEACEVEEVEEACEVEAHTSPYFNKKSSDNQGTSSPWGGGAGGVSPPWGPALRHKRRRQDQFYQIHWHCRRHGTSRSIRALLFLHLQALSIHFYPYSRQ